ncbi:MAG TPA: cation-translocating P-type ATPase [Steroidobacteraceae bacterium]
MFAIEGMWCSACSRTITQAVGSVAGVEHISVNVATGRAAVDWDACQVSLEHILQVVVEAGFRPAPLAGEAATAVQRRERRSALLRIGVAGLGMLLTMTLVYAAGWHGIDSRVAGYLKAGGLVSATAVLLYSGASFFGGAVRKLWHGGMGMDVPVALALALAYGASVANTIRGEGAIYFDSVTMCVLVLLTGRYVEMTIRQRNLSATEALARSLPTQVMRVGAEGITERISPSQVQLGDLLAIPKGGVIPVDALLVEGEAVAVDESLVTGESVALPRHRGQMLLGGSINVGHPIKVKATSCASDSKVAGIVALLEQTQAGRASFTPITDRLAGWFVLSTVLLASCAALLWFFVEPARAIPAALAVLVVTCPCALSLATPATVAAATARLARLGVLVTRSGALERLADVDEVVLDKTGTLTRGMPTVELRRIAQWQSRAEVFAIAAALESISDHAIATAFRAHRTSHREVSEAQEFAGRGIEGSVDGVRWRIGTRDFVAEIDQSDPDDRVRWDDPGIGFVLGNSLGVVAAFALCDGLRPGARRAVRQLREIGLKVTVASGDQASVVQTVSQELDIPEANSRLTPQEKLALVQGRQRAGARVLMVGDGINDGPVLAAASVSCAMAQGSAVAQAAADLLLLNESLDTLADAIAIARQMRTVIHQNLACASICSLAAVPMAALGWMPPWVAVIGMICSSLLVVSNAVRLARAGGSWGCLQKPGDA